MENTERSCIFCEYVIQWEHKNNTEDNDMKRWLLILLTLLLMAAFAACDEDPETSNGTDTVIGEGGAQGDDSKEETTTQTESMRLQAMTASMAPTINTGDWVEYEPVTSPGTLSVGDIVVVDDGQGNLWIRRILEITYSERGILMFILKGDGNPVADPEPCSAGRVRGLVTSHS